MADNPMQSAHSAPRCSAKSKRSGQRCKAPAVRGWSVCRMHGARSGAPKGKANGNYVNGAHTLETKVLALIGRMTNLDAREFLGNLNKKD